MKNKPEQLTDDEINKFVYELTEFLEEEEIVDQDFFEEDENWELLLGFVFEKLEKFSNGYLNYN